MKYQWLYILFFVLARSVEGQEAKTDVVVHDPVMIRQNDIYYVFCTGRGISVWKSSDLKHWIKEKPVFASAPSWIKETIPEFKGDFWAPDISYYRGLYYLFYAVSVFGKNSSCIGVATNKTLDPADKDFKWTDHGKVIESIPGKTNWNAIDPNLVVDREERPYLAFGSFWDGIKLVRLRKDAMRPAESLATLPTIARRFREVPRDRNYPVTAGSNAIEAPFIFRRNGWYYLFASIDYCCRGNESTYKVIVGRSANLQGPYIDKSGVAMTEGGGVILLQGNSLWHGVGHNAVYTVDKNDLLIFHGYDALDGGKPKLRIETLKWDEMDWPVLQSPGGNH